MLLEDDITAADRVFDRVGLPTGGAFYGAIGDDSGCINPSSLSQGFNRIIGCQEPVETS